MKEFYLCFCLQQLKMNEDPICVKAFFKTDKLRVYITPELGLSQGPLAKESKQCFCFISNAAHSYF